MLLLIGWMIDRSIDCFLFSFPSPPTHVSLTHFKLIIGDFSPHPMWRWLGNDLPICFVFFALHCLSCLALPGCPNILGSTSLAQRSSIGPFGSDVLGSGSLGWASSALAASAQTPSDRHSRMGTPRLHSFAWSPPLGPPRLGSPLLGSLRIGPPWIGFPGSASPARTPSSWAPSAQPHQIGILGSASSAQTPLAFGVSGPRLDSLTHGFLGVQLRIIGAW